MSVNGVVANADLIPEIMSSLMYDELRANLPIAMSFERKYEGDLVIGDKVKVNQIAKATGEILTDDTANFNPETMTISQIEIDVNSRASASFEFTDLAQLQSQSFEADAREALVYGISKQIEDAITAALLPSTSAPDHDIAPIAASDLAAADLGAMRSLLSAQSVPNSNRIFFAAPSYYADLLSKTSLTSSDYIPAGSPVTTGGFTFPLYGFTIVEAQNLAADIGYAVHTSAVQVIMQQGLRVKVSDQHANRKYGFILSADMVFGYKLMDNVRIVKISA